MTFTLQPEDAFLLAAALTVAMVPPGFGLYWSLLRRLRTEHHETWERFGRPTVVFYSSMSNRRALHRFVADAEYESLGDPDFTRFCGIYHGYAQVYSAVVVATVLLFALVMLARL